MWCLWLGRGSLHMDFCHLGHCDCAPQGEGAETPPCAGREPAAPAASFKVSFPHCSFGLIECIFAEVNTQARLLISAQGNPLLGGCYFPWDALMVLALHIYLHHHCSLARTVALK